MCLFFGLDRENCPTKEKTCDRSYETPDSSHCAVGIASHSRVRGPDFDTQSSHINFLFLCLFLLIQEGQLSFTGESTG